MTKQAGETSALIDSLRMEANLERMASFFGNAPAWVRPHFKNQECPDLAVRQLA